MIPVLALPGFHALWQQDRRPARRKSSGDQPEVTQPFSPQDMLGWHSLLLALAGLLYLGSGEFYDVVPTHDIPTQQAHLMSSWA